MAGGRRIPVTVEADVDGSFDRAARGLDDVAKSADKTDRSIGQLTKGHQALDAEIDKTVYSAKSLREEFARTGDIGLLKDARKLDNAAKSLQKLRVEFDKFHNDSSGSKKSGGLFNFVLDAGKATGKAIVGGVQDGVQSADKWLGEHPLLAGGIAAGITLGAPVIGGAVAAAVGLGGIAGGILLASKDPRVGQAWGAVAKTAEDGLSKAAGVFVDPLVRGARTFNGTMNAILPHIESDFAVLAPVAEKLFVGAGGFVERLMPGIDALTRASGPVLSMIADELPKLGAAVSMAFQDIAAGGEGGKEALHDMLVSVEGTTIAVGKLVEWTEKLYVADRALFSSYGDAKKNWQDLIYGQNAAVQVAPAVASAFQAVTAAVGNLGPGAMLTADQMKALSGAISGTEITADTLAGQMTGKLFNSIMSLDQATLGFAEAQTRLSDSIQQNGHQLDIHTAKGQANRESVLAVVGANMQQYQANIAAGMSAADAAKAYDTNTAALDSQLHKAGFTQQAIDGLIGKYRNVPDKVDTDIATRGLTAAIQGLDDLIRRINNIPTKRDIYITQHLGSVGSFYQSPDRLYDTPASRWGNVFTHAAVGVLRDASIYSAVSSGARYAFAEPGTGGEAFVPKNGKPSRSLGILSQAASWYDADVVPRSGYAAPVAVPSGGRGAGGNTYQISVAVAPGANPADVGAAVVDAIHAYERNNGSGWRS